MTVPGVLIHYESKLRELQAASAPSPLRTAIVAMILAAALGAILVLSLSAIRKQAFSLWPLVPIPVVALAIRDLLNRRRSRYRAWRLKRFYERGVERVQGTWAGAGLTGEEFIDPDHVYAGDLNIFGQGSLFQLLCTARTSLGQRGLAGYLSDAPSAEESRLRQGAVRELSARIDLREKVAMLGEFEFPKSQAEAFEEWLSTPPFTFPRFLPVVMAVTSITLACLVLAVFGGLAWSKVSTFIWPLLAFHAAVGIHYRDRVNEKLESIRSLAVETHVLCAGLALLESEQFQSEKMQWLVTNIQNGSSSIKRLERLFDAVQQRDKEWFFLPSRALLVGTQLACAIEKCRREHGQHLRAWLSAWEEFEALNSLGVYAYENPDNAFPQILNGEAGFEAQGLAHPLLDRTSVANDVQLNREVPFYVVSGSNMSGKSTLLRSIGLNAVLAYAGAPVRALSLRLSGLSVFASLSLVDSLLNGRSKFMVEVDRLKQAIESSVENKSVLFLVDEIFSGTNSRDRRIAAEAVVRTLVERGGIGALSTHDLALTEIAGAEGLPGINVHMGSRDENDPLAFDYRLKLGVTTETNALAIARMAGVPIAMKPTPPDPSVLLTEP